jgi:hypothetical protein
MLFRSFAAVLFVCLFIAVVDGEISATANNWRLFKSSLGFETTEAANNNDEKPVEAIKVIGAGFGRTGTQSLKVALQQLGYKANHFEETFSRPDVYLPGWEAVLTGEGAGNYLRILSEQGFNATLDSANALLYKEMMAAYPDAKVLLSVRSDGAEAWATSCLETVWKFKKIWSSPPFTFKKSFRTISALINWIWEGMAFGLDKKHDEITHEDLVAGYNAWVADVLRTVPPERLLVFRMQDGRGGLSHGLLPARQRQKYADVAAQGVPDDQFHLASVPAPLCLLVPPCAAGMHGEPRGQTQKRLSYSSWNIIIISSRCITSTI